MTTHAPLRAALGPSLPRALYSIVTAIGLLLPVGSASAGLVTALSSTSPSTSSQLNFVVSGTVSASDFGVNYASDPNPRFFIYIPGLEWLSGNLANTVNNASNGSGNTGPTIVGVDYTLLSNNTSVGGTQDLIQLANSNLWPSSSTFQIGQTIDWAFSVRNFNIPGYDFNAFIAAAPGGISNQIGSGPVVPEPSTYAMALAGLACGGYSMFRRRKRA